MKTTEHLEKIKAKLEELIVRYKSGTGGAPLAIAGWKSTLRTIAMCRQLPSPDSSLIINEILASWPIELLQ
jgi:hypothetical protein